jgi:hypothetical protein
MTARRVITEHVFPAIPTRRWDWIAYLEEFDLGEPVGMGSTEEAAIADLQQELLLRSEK